MRTPNTSTKVDSKMEPVALGLGAQTMHTLFSPLWCTGDPAAQRCGTAGLRWSTQGGGARRRNPPCCRSCCHENGNARSPETSWQPAAYCGRRAWEHLLAAFADEQGQVVAPPLRSRFRIKSAKAPARAGERTPNLGTPNLNLKGDAKEGNNFVPPLGLEPFASLTQEISCNHLRTYENIIVFA